MSLIKKLFGRDEKAIKETNRALVFTKWINDKLRSDNEEEINTIQDLTSGVKLIKLIDILWGKTDLDIHYNPKNTKEKIENYQIILEFLKTKRQIEIPNYNNNLSNIVKNKDTTNLLQILWTIIYNHTIKWITLFGSNGEKALLHWCSSFTITPINNFTDDWKDGKLLSEILNNYYPNTIDMRSFDINQVLEKFNEKNVPVYIQLKDFQYMDESSIILQCASLYNFFSSLEFLRSGENVKNDQQNLPDFENGILNESDLESMDKTQKKIILKLNQHFYPVFPSRQLIQVALINKVGQKLKVDYNFEAFNQAVLKAGSRPIIFVSCIGRYQQGKSTIISGLTGNLSYKIGNRLQEETKGVFIDGPYELDYFYQRFQIEKRENIYFEGNEFLSPVVYFFDMEGYGGVMHGNAIDQNNQAFIQMCTPFLCLSSIFIFLTDTNISKEEIKELIERMKVSSLTTFPNSQDSNGALSLLLLFNKHNSIHPSQKSQDPYTFENLKASVNDEENLFSIAWNGAVSLRDYGINYEFSMILEAEPHHFEDGSFYDSFQLFSEKVIRLIENATEGSFFRCSQESINLFNYIVEHYNEPLFDNNIKKLIKEQHEHSFRTIANQAYKKSKKKILPHIDQEFDFLCQQFDIEYDYNDFRQRLLNEGTIELNKELEVVKDHPQVLELFIKFNGELNLYIQEKDDQYQRIRRQKIEESNNQIEQFAAEKLVDILFQIQKVLSDNNNFNYDQNKIDECINNFYIQLKDYLIQYKNKENLFLVTDEVIIQVSENKKDVIGQHILPIIQRKREEEILQLQQEIEVKELIVSMINDLLNQHYNNCQSTEILRLREKLYHIDFYRENYANTINIVDQIQGNIIQNMNEHLQLVITNSCNHFSRIDEIKRNAIQRLNNKRHVFYQQDNINVIVEKYRQNLIDTVNRTFNTAREYLAENVVESRRVPIPIISVSVETKTTIIFPEGLTIEGEWVQVRTERRNFAELLDGISQGINIVGRFAADTDEAITHIIEAIARLRYFFI